MLGQLVVSGVAQGALYALVALAMTVVYRATTVVNFGQGDFVMAGAFVVYVLVVLAGTPFIAAGALSIALLCAFGWAVYRGLIRPILAGPSRKSFLKSAVGDVPPRDRLWGTAAAVAASILLGAHIVRVHDVKEIETLTQARYETGVIPEAAGDAIDAKCQFLT